MRQTWTFHSAGKLVFGPGAVDSLGELVREAGHRRALLVTDAPLAAAGVLDTVRRPLVAAKIEVDVFDGGEPEPSFAAAEAALARAKKFEPDVVIGLGGGSNMDLAKVTATILAHGGKITDYVGDCRVPGPIRPLICVPTTAGTGSEVSCASVLTDRENEMKVALLSNYLRPAMAVVDPRLTLGCPAKVSADSGLDALTHAIEAYTAIDNAHFAPPEGERTVYQGLNPIGEQLAERAIQLIGEHLITAVTEPENLAAREGMALAAVLAGLAFSNIGVALVHAMEYPVGGAVHCSHGEGNGLLLPHVMKFNLPERREKFARIARLLGRDTEGLDAESAADMAIIAVDHLRGAVGVPRRLSEIGVRPDQLRGFSEKAFGLKRILRVNPREVTVADVLGIYFAAL